MSEQVWREQTIAMLKLITADVESGKYRLQSLPAIERDAMEGPPDHGWRTFAAGPMTIVIKFEEVV